MVRERAVVSEMGIFRQMASFVLYYWQMTTRGNLVLRIEV
jgi:hypothetical protein